MILTSDEIRDTLAKLWPELSFVWLRNTRFYAPPLADINYFLNENDVNSLIFYKWNAECDYFALMLHADAKEWFRGGGPVTIGEIFGDRFNGTEGPHHLNIAITDTKEVHIIEPQADGIWKANPVEDNVLILTM